MGNVFRIAPQNGDGNSKYIYTKAHMKYGELENTVEIPQQFANDPSNIIAIDLIVSTASFLNDQMIPYIHSGDTISWEFNGLPCSITLE